MNSCKCTVFYYIFDCMRLLKKVILVLIFPSLVHSQNIIGLSLGRSFENALYGHIFNANLDYFCALKNFTIKVGGAFEPGTHFGLKYSYYGALGITSNIAKRISVHFLTGMINLKTERRSYHYNFQKIEHSDGGAPMLNVGGFFALNTDKNFLIGFELFAWPQTLYIGRGWSNEIASSVNLSANYRFGFKLKKRTADRKSTRQ